MILDPIPTISFPKSRTKGILSDEQLVELSQIDTDIKYTPMYYNAKIIGATDKCYLRYGVWQKLLQAKKLLPNGYNFVILDAFRPLTVQQSLWDNYKQILLNNGKRLSKSKLRRQIQQFVAKPTTNKRMAPLHCTGGAVDITLSDENGNLLDMGSEFDSFCLQSHTNYFELALAEKRCNRSVANNRRILFNAMTSVGFTNLPTEWWHYDYGDRFWAYYNNTDVIYGKISLDKHGK